MNQKKIMLDQAIGIKEILYNITKTWGILHCWFGKETTYIDKICTARWAFH